MRMSFFFSEIFWGGLLILIGVSAILKSFNINIPILRIAFALFFIYLGLSIFFGHSLFLEKDRNTVIFSETNIRVEELNQREFNIIFGKGVVDLRGISIEDDELIEINTIFGSADVIIPDDIPVVIRASSVFGSASLPDGNNVTFGDLSYRSPKQEGTKNRLTVKANVVFGGLDITRK